MQLRLRSRDTWHKTLWKVVSNPAIEVVVAILAVLVAAWFVVQTEVENRNALQIPFLFGHE